MRVDGHAAIARNMLHHRQFADFEHAFDDLARHGDHEVRIVAERIPGGLAASLQCEIGGRWVACSTAEIVLGSSVGSWRMPFALTTPATAGSRDPASIYDELAGQA